jgi:glucokinase
MTNELYIAGIEIGGTKIQVFISDNKLNIVEKFADKVGDAKEAAAIQQKITSFLDKAVIRYNLKAISVGFGGPVDYKTGEVFTSYQVSSWQDFNIKLWLEEKYGVKVFIENDANTAAFAEAHIGNGKGFQRVFYITLGSGVGGGFVNGGKLYHGMPPGESEFGHIRLDKSGRTVESACSGWAVDNALKKYISENTESIIAKLAKDSGKSEATFLNKAIVLGDSGAKKILDEVIDNLAFGISHVVHILHPEVIILGGGLSLTGKYLVEKTKENLIPYLMSSMKYNPPEVRLAKLGTEVVPLGAILLANQAD